MKEQGDFIIDRSNEWGEVEQEVVVYFPDGYKVRFWAVGLTDDEYIFRAKQIRGLEN